LKTAVDCTNIEIGVLKMWAVTGSLPSFGGRLVSKQHYKAEFLPVGSLLWSAVCQAFLLNE